MFNQKTVTLSSLLLILLLTACNAVTQPAADPQQPIVALTPVSSSTAHPNSELMFTPAFKSDWPYRFRVYTVYYQMGDAGETVVHTITVANEGTEADTYTVTANSSLGWADLSTVPDSLTLAAQSTAQFTVAVTIPLTAERMISDELMVEARSPHLSWDDSSTSLTQAACHVTFSDLQPGMPEYEDALWTACYGVMTGIADGKNRYRFEPTTPVTYAELKASVDATMQRDYGKVGDAEVACQDPLKYSAFDEFAINFICTGLLERKAFTDRPLRRGEAIAIFTIKVGFTLYDPFEGSFSDVNNNYFAYPAVETLISRHDIERTPCKEQPELNCFQPEAVFTRAELARLLRQYLDD